MEKMEIKNKNGFLLIEMLIAIMIFFIAATAFIPLLIYITDGTQFNKVRLVATKLASSQIEYIRSLPYSQVGSVAGNPSGNIAHIVPTVLNGITFTTTTDITWVNDPSDDVSGADPIPYDYKRVIVSVAAPGFTKAVTSVANIRTVVAMEGEEEAFPGGNIRAKTYRAWNMSGTELLPESDIQVDLGPSPHQTLWTDEVGIALFAILDEGSYTISADATSKGLMVNPIQSEQDCIVSQGVTTLVNFEVEKPCYLAINLKNKKTGQMVNTPGSIVLSSALTGPLAKDITSEIQGFVPTALFGEIWPMGVGYPGAYNILVNMQGYQPYDLSIQTPIPPWDGTFSAPGQTKTVDLELTPNNSMINVTSSGNSLPILDATVEVYQHTYTYQSGGWVGICSSTPIETAQTTTDGNSIFALDDNNPFDPPAVPANGSTYTRYCVKVTASGYQTFNIQHDAFGMKGGTQTISPYLVVLMPNPVPTPAGCSIKVLAKRNYGTARNDVNIKIVDSLGVTKGTAKTGSGGIAGQVVFSGLLPGTYTVYRWYNNNWNYARSVTAVSGEYIITYQY